MPQHQENKDNAHGKQVEVKDSATAHVADTININNYESSRPPRGIPFQALALPKDYVDRPEIRQKIKSKLIDCSMSRPGTLVVSAIYGLGGVGKSVMAAALAHDAEIQKVCADGVLWVTLGQNPDLLSFLYGWVQKLGDNDFKPTNIDSASGHLRSLLHDKKMLLVVDDAWHTDHVVPFQVGGAGCRVLVTTREAEVLDADRIDMDVMSEAESLELLLSKAQVKSLTVDEEQQAKKLIAVVGGLPLAVDLAGAQVADGMSWNELLEDLEAEIAYLESLDRPNFEGVRDEKTRKRLSLKASLNLSLKLLSVEQLQQFTWLGVLPEDVAIQPDMAATLWSIPRKKAGAVLRTFRAKALLLSGVQGIGQDSSYRIHDLMHDLARGLLTSKGEKDIPGLDLEWPDAHGILLDQYCLQATDQLWHTLPDDGYIYSYLTWHMEKAGRLNELHGLFQEVTSEGRNGWYNRCELAKFVTDLRRVWKLAEELYIKDASQSIVLQIRYALIFSTLNSLANIIPAKLIGILVQRKKWSPAQGLSYANYAKQFDPARCVTIIGELAPHLSSTLISEVLSIVCGIQNEDLLAKGVCFLLTYLPGNELQDILKIACELRGEPAKSVVLSALIPNLPINALPEILEVAIEMKISYHQATVLNALAPYLSEDQLLKLLNIALKIQNESHKAELINVLIPHLRINALPEILEVALRMRSNSHRITILTTLAPYLSEKLLLNVLNIALEIQNESDQIALLKALIPHLSEITLSDVLEIAYSIQNKSKKSELLGSLALRLPQIMQETLKLAFDCNTNVLNSLLPYLPEHSLLDAFDLVSEMQCRDSEKINAISSFILPLPKEILLKILIEIRKIKDDSSRARILSALVPYLPEIATECLRIARGLQSEYTKVDVMSTLIPYLPEISLEVLENINEMTDKESQSDILKNLTPHLSTVVLEALNVASKIRDEYEQYLAFGNLVSYLPEIIPEILIILSKINSESEKAKILVCLVSYHEFLSEILVIVYEMKNELYQAEVLSNFALYISEKNLSELLVIVSEMKNELYQAEVLSNFAPYISEKNLSELLVIVSEMKNELYQAEVLISLAMHSPSDFAQEILEDV